MKVPKDIKERMKQLGNDFANKESRNELYRLIHNYLHDCVEPVSSK
jgi:hypothetical protein